MTPKTFSWKRGVAHAMIPVAILIAAAAVLIATDHVARVDDFTEGLTKFTIFVFAITLGLSHLVQTGRRREALFAGLATAALVGILIATALVGRSDHPKVAEWLKQPLIRGDARLTHPVLHFSIKDPGAAFVESPTVAKAMTDATANDPLTYSYGYAKGSPSAPDAALVITVFSGMGNSKSELDQYLDGMTRMFASKLPNATVLEHAVSWMPGTHEGRFHAVFGGANHVYVRVHAVPRTDGEPYVVSLVAIAHDADTLSDVVTSFRE
jgi:hypothetical protein